MTIIAFNASPRKKGNTSTIIRAMLEGAASAGAETQEIRLHDINMKGCQACYACKEKPGVCALKDELTPSLHAIKDSTGIILGCPIYMYRISGQMKILVDRLYSYYQYKSEGSGYDSAVPPGKTFALAVSQGAPDPNQYHRSIRWLAGMAGAGLGLEEAGRIIHGNSREVPAADDEKLLEEARAIGKKMAARG
jgi:multimeric flavodoxin WrbA